MAKPVFEYKQSIISSEVMNIIAGTIWDALGAAGSPEAARFAMDVPQDTTSLAPMARIDGVWVPVSESLPGAHAYTHMLGGTDEVNHDTLLNGGGDKHTSHAGVTITAGSGLSGGGDITASRTISFNYLLQQDLSAGGYRIVSLSDPINILDGVNKQYADNLLITAGANPWAAGIPANSIYFDTGNVGIGHNNPSQRLDVLGNALVTGNSTVTGQMYSGTLQVDGQAVLNDVLVVQGEGILNANLSIGTGIAAVEALEVNGNVVRVGETWHTELAGCRYRKMPDEMVELRLDMTGQLWDGQALPAGYRPSAPGIIDFVEASSVPAEELSRITVSDAGLIGANVAPESQTQEFVIRFYADGS